jgi:hypothetical protein
MNDINGCCRLTMVEAATKDAETSLVREPPFDLAAIKSHPSDKLRPSLVA